VLAALSGVQNREKQEILAPLYFQELLAVFRSDTVRIVNVQLYTSERERIDLLRGGRCAPQQPAIQKYEFQFE